MRREIYLTLLYIVSILACSSCEATIFEEREDCPCFLTLDLSNVPPTMGELYLWAFDSKENLILRDTILSTHFGGEYEVVVKRTTVHYHLWGNIGSATSLLGENSVNLKLSKVDSLSADSLYCYSKKLNATGEFAKDTVTLFKEYARVKVLVKRAKDTFIEIKGESNGYFLNREIVDAKSIYKSVGLIDSNSDMLHTFNITRQSNLSLLEIALSHSINKRVTLLNTYPIGEWLEEQGYNMDAENLSDIYIEIDSSNNFITITVDDWSYTPEGNVEI